MSQRFFKEKFEVAWLLALSFAYLYRRQNDTVLLFHDNAEEGPVNLKSAADFIALDSYFQGHEKNLKNRKPAIVYSHAREQLGAHLRAGNKVIWVTDLYIPLNEYLEILGLVSGLKARLNLVHLNSSQDYLAKKTRPSFLKKLIDVETGTWMPSSKVHNYDKIWEEAISTRMRFLVSRGHNYIKGNVEDGPIHILGASRFL